MEAKKEAEENEEMKKTEKKPKKGESKKEEKSEKILKIPRDIVVPGEVIVSGEDYLPSDGTMRESMNIIATRFGLVEFIGRLVKVIPLSGVYIPRRGNTVIGKVIDITYNGLRLDIGAPYEAFLPMKECFFPHGRELEEYFNIGDMIIVKIFSIRRGDINLTMRDRGLNKLEGGMTITVNPNKVPRVIGKEGSMVNMIKQETGCLIVVGQNGIIWIRGENIDAELLAKEAILLITSKSHIEGLTDFVQDFLEKAKKGKEKLIK